MLLCILAYANFKLKDTIIFMSFITNLIQNVADSMVHTYAVKLSLIYLIASARASSYENDPSIVAVCDNSSMYLNVEFVRPFHGLIYTSGNAFTPECSIPTSPLLNNSRLTLALPFSTCSLVVDAVDNETISISSTIIVQHHRMIQTSYDIIQNVTCELSLPIFIFRQWSYPNATLTAGHLNSSLVSGPKVRTWIETRIGSDLFPEDDSEVGAELFFVINVIDGGKNRDMSVHNCIAHDERVLTNETLLYQMSDVFGCPNASYVLSSFTVSNRTEGHADLMAYTQMRNLVYTVKGEFFVTCGVVLCENSCRNMCENKAIPMHYLSDIVTRRFVGRPPGATLPPSLNLFETRQRISKRSLNDIFTRWLSFRSSDLEVNDVSLREDHTTESTQTLIEKQLENATALYIASISKDFEFNMSNNPLAVSANPLVNKTRSGFGHNYKISKYSILPEFTVCVLFILLVSCYGGLLYSNSKKNNFRTELYSIIY